MRRPTKTCLLPCLLAVCCVTPAVRSQPPETWLSTSTVGMPERIEQLVLPGAVLRVRPLEDRHQPLVLRMIETFPHGTAHRYDLEYYALEPGDYNLADYLQRVDGSDAEPLPSLPVRVFSTLPGGHIVPSEPGDANVGRIGGYRWAISCAAAMWLVGLAALVLVGRRRPAEQEGAVELQEPLANRWERLLAEVRGHRLTKEREAELERNVIAFWRQELNLQQTPSAELIQSIRRDEEAAAMLDELDRWFHHPRRDGELDLNQLLSPIDRRLRARMLHAESDSPVEPVARSRDGVNV